MRCWNRSIKITKVLRGDFVKDDSGSYAVFIELWVPLEGNFVRRETSWKTSVWNWDGKKSRTGNVHLFFESRKWVRCRWNRRNTSISKNLQKLSLMWKKWTKNTWDVLIVNANRTKVSLRNTERCSNHDNVREQLENLTQKRSRGDTTWKVTRKSASNDFANWRRKAAQLYPVSTPCLEDHNLKKEELETVGDLSKMCSRIVLKCLYWSRIG